MGDEVSSGRAAADRLASDWDNRDWIPTSPSTAWARAAVDRFGEIIADQPSIFRASMKGADRGASTLSPRPFQGLVESLQNADDLGATELHVAFQGGSKPRLLIVHNGSPVSLANVGAMLLPWLSTKDEDPDVAGRFGIGQRTLRSIGGPITLHAPPFHFTLSDDGPVSTAPHPDVDGVYFAERRDTMIVIPLAKDMSETKIAKAVCDLGLEALLFLESIRALHFHNLEDPSKNVEFAADLVPVGIRQIVFDGQPADVHVSDIELVSPDQVDARRSYRRYSTRRVVREGEKRSNKATGASTPLGVCVPTDVEPKPLPLFDRMPMPVTTGLSIGLNAQFDPDAARSALLPNDWNWNRFVDLGQLVAWAALDAFRDGLGSAWNHVPLVKEADNGEGWTNDRVRELVVEASHSSLREQLVLQTSAGTTPVADIVYESEELEALVNEQDLHRLREGKVALPRDRRDRLGRWRLVLGELNCSVVIDVQDALEIVDGNSEREPSWYVGFAVVAERHNVLNSLISRPSLLLADGSVTARPAPGEVWVLVKSASPSALSTRLNLAHRLHPAYFDDDAGSTAVISKLEALGVLFDNRDNATDVFTILERGSSSLGEAPTTIRLNNADLLALRDAWATLPRERHADLGPTIGQRVELRVTWHDAGGKRVTGWCRPVEAYMPAAIDREVDSFAKAAGQTPGIKWVDASYAKVLKQKAGRSAIGPQRLLSAWGVAREPRLVRPADEQIYWSRDTTPASLVATQVRTPDQMQSIRTGGRATHLLEDRWSPDAEAVAEDIARAPPKTRRKRGTALLATLARGWERRYSEFATAFSAYAYNGYWNRVAEIRATWLARLADIRWMPDAGNGVQRPADLQMSVLGSPPRRKQRSSTFANFDTHVERTGVLAALGVKAGPTQRDLIERLRALRQTPITSNVIDEASTIYQLLAASLREKGESVSDGRMTPAQLRNAFRAGSDGPGLLLAGGRWHSPEATLRGPAIFGDRRVFAPHIDGLDPLWTTLGIDAPSVTHAIAVLKEIAAAVPTSEDLGIGIRALTVMSEGVNDMSPQMRTALRRLPLWTGSEWTVERPIYALDGDALQSSAPAALNVWRPGLTSFEAIEQLLDPLGVVRLRSSDFRPASVPAYGFAEGDNLRPTFAKAVSLLRQEFGRVDQSLLDGIDVDWDELSAALVVVDPDLTIVADLVSGPLKLTARAHVGRDPLCLIVRSESEASTAEGAGAAIASLFAGDRQKVAWAWAAIWSRATSGEQVDGAVLPTTQARPGDRKERLDQLANQAAQRRKSKARRPKPGAKSDSYSPPVKIRKLRDLDQLEPNQGTIINQGAIPTGELVFAKRRTPTGERKYDRDTGDTGSTSAHRPARSVPAPTNDRERMALEAVRRALQLDVKQFNDLRNARGVGVDAVDELRQCYEIKMNSGGAVPTDVTLTASELEAAKKDPDFFLAVVSGLEEGDGKLRVRFIFDPLSQLDVRIRGDVTLTGVDRAQALQFEFDEVDADASPS